MSSFKEIRDFLDVVRSKLGSETLVGVVWDGASLKLTAARPASQKPLVVMTFDSEKDFETSKDELVDGLKSYCDGYFGEANVA